MMKYTPLQTLGKVHSELWWTIRLLGSVEVQFDHDSPTQRNCEGIGQVLRAMAKEVEVIIRRERDKEPNQRNLRQAEEFALKAQIAKAGEAAPAHRQLCRDDQSHK